MDSVISKELLKNKWFISVIMLIFALILLIGFLIKMNISLIKDKKELEVLNQDLKIRQKEMEMQLTELQVLREQMEEYALIVQDLPTIDQLEAIVQARENEIRLQQEKIKSLERGYDKVVAKVVHVPVESITPTRGTMLAGRGVIFEATAYDLSVASCGKPIGHPSYGKTAGGLNLAGKSREEAMVVAADPKVLPLGTKVKLTFGEGYEEFTGVYTVGDTGSAVKGNIVDVFLGDFNSNDEHPSVRQFGRVKVKVQVVEGGE